MSLIPHDATLPKTSASVAAFAAGPTFTSVSSASAVDPLSFSGLWAIMARRWRLFLGVTLICMAVSVVAAFLIPPQFSAVAQLLIDPRPHAPAAATADRITAAPDATLVDTEVQLVTSPSVLDAVARRLDLANDPEFRASPHSTDPAEAVAENLAKKLDVGRQGLTYMVAVRAHARQAGRSAAIANLVTQEYLRQSKALRAKQAADQAQTLLAEIGPLGREVVDSDEAVARFKSSHHIVSSGSNGPTGAGTVTEQQTATIAAELGRASADAAAARAAAATAQEQVRQAGEDSVSQVLNSPSMTELRNQRAQVLREQAQLAGVYGPDHPALVRINGQLAKLDKEIKEAADHVVSGLQADARAASQRESVVRGQLSGLEGKLQQDAQASAVAAGLQRDADAKRATFNDLSRSAQEQAQEARIGEVRAWIASPATIPLAPSFPKKSIFLIIGAIVGMVAGAVAAAGRELGEDGFRTGEEAASELRAPLLAAVPELPDARRPLLWSKRNERVCWDHVLNKPVSSFAEAIRNVRAALLGHAEGPGPKAICVTSAVMGEGKSAIAVALARVMAMSGDRVLLVDCDLRRGGLAKLRGDTAEQRAPTGLMEVLHGKVDAQSAIVPDVVPGLSLLCLDSPVFTARDLFSGQAARELLDHLRSDYDFIILDAPPVLAVTDAWTIASICDATLMVVRHGKTARAAVRAAAARLSLRGSSPGGVILNRRPPTRGPETDYYEGVHAAYFVE
jgi:capsular exopolysaccharide synthesis family protein